MGAAATFFSTMNEVEEEFPLTCVPAASKCACWRFIGSLLMFSTLAGCRSGPSHPPTFDDFRRAIREDATHTNLDAQVAIFAAAQLSNKEMQRFLTRGSVEELVGAGTQAPMTDPLGRTLLQHATERSPAAPMVWAALAYRDMSLLQNQEAGIETIADELTTAINRWRSLEPTNAAPWYLEAAFQCLRTNVASAKQLMAEADRKEGFEPCSLAIQKCVIRAMESARRSKYIARLYAMGQVVGVVGWSKLSKTILAESSEDQQAIRSCFVLGARVGLGKSFLEQLIGDSIQTKAIEKLSGADFAAERARISERKARIRRATAYNTSLDTRKFSEERWVRFLDTCFDKGEMTAVESMAADNGDTF